jgi:hypothetical protein
MGLLALAALVIVIMPIVGVLKIYDVGSKISDLQRSMCSISSSLPA